MLVFSMNLSAQLIPCNHQAHIALNTQGLANATIDSWTLQNPLSQNLLTSNLNQAINAMGYNVRDQKIYGLNPTNYHLLRIDANGNVEDLGVPNFLDTSFNYFTGDVNPTGTILYVLAKNKATGIDERLYTINLTTETFNAGWVPAVSINDLSIGDMAFDPIFGIVYGFDNNNKKIVSISIGGSITDFAAESIGQRVVGLFFDEKGTLWGLSENGKLLEFNKFNGTLVSEQNAIVNGTASDGCSCPYQIDFFQTVKPEIILPCTEIEIVYYTENTAGTTYGQIEIIDTLPENVIITEIVQPPFFATIESGIGSNIFKASGMQILLGRDSIVIKAFVDELDEGIYSMQGKISPLPIGLGETILADNARTNILVDETTFEVITNASEIIEEDVLYVCEGGTIEIFANASSELLEWSTGETSPSILVNTLGIYSVEVQTDCANYTDEVLVAYKTADLEIDLGSDIEIIQGENYSLSYETNSTSILDFDWQVLNSENTLTCTNCAEPILNNIIENISVRVFVKDEFGCESSDTLNIIVNKERVVFIPNAFSPNDDGINDEFTIFAENTMIQSFQIFDRWGSLLWQTNNAMIGSNESSWNALYKNKKVKAGIYIWTALLEFPDGATERFSGDVLVLY